MATKREILLDFLARDRSKAAVDSFAKGVKGAGDAADKAGKQAKGFGDDAEKGAKRADELGDEAKQAERRLSSLNTEILKSKGALLGLGKAFADAGSKAERLDITKQIRGVETEVRKLEKAKGIIAKALTPPEPDPASMGKFAGLLSKGVAGLANPVGLALGVGIAAAAGPTLVQGLSTAVTAGIGGAGIGAGIALAVSNDKGIQQAGANIGKKLISGLQDQASKNFGGPIRQALGIVDDAASRTIGKLAGLFDGLSGYVVPLVRDIVQAGDRIIDMFVNIGQDSGTALLALGDSLRLVVDGVGDFFEEISSGGQSSADSLTLISGALADVIRWTGKLISTVNEITDSEWLGIWPILKQHYRDQAAESDTLAGSTAKVAEEFTNADRAARGEQAALEALSNELRAQTDPVFGLLNAQEKLKAAQDKVKESTKDHGAKSKETQQALRDLANAALDMEGQAGKLGNAFDGKMTPALRATLTAAGATKGQIDGLEAQFRNAKKTGENFAKTYKARVRAEGAGPTKAQLDRVRSAADAVAGTYTVTVAMRITGNNSISATKAALRKNSAVEGRAAGGPITAGRPYWVGENGPELVLPSRSGYVLNHLQSRQAGRSPFGPQFTPKPQKLMMEMAGPEEMRTMLRYMIRSMNLLEG